MLLLRYLFLYMFCYLSVCNFIKVHFRYRYCYGMFQKSYLRTFHGKGMDMSENLIQLVYHLKTFAILYAEGPLMQGLILLIVEINMMVALHSGSNQASGDDDCE